MSFDVAADAYDSFMGRYSALLAPGFADFGGVRAGQTVLDVGCGPGALTSELVRRLGTKAVAAVDPSESFVVAARARLPGVDVRKGTVERLPFEPATFDVTLAQLVFHFLGDPIAGVREMARVTRKDGIVAACVWDFAGGRAPVSIFWTVARELDATVQGESLLPGARREHLSELFRTAGLREIEFTEISLIISFEKFEEWWQPFTRGVGPAGAYAQRVGEARLSTIRDRCRAILGEGPFAIRAVTWAARGTV